jgi:hypothetical protein
MEDKSLADKAIDIKGKQYVLVQDRVVYFNENYPKGSITTELISLPDSPHIIIKARVSPDDSPRIFTGYSQAKIGDGYINKTSALENAETSAVGRALAFMGIGVIESIASADEMHKASQPASAKPAAKPKEDTKTMAQKDRIMNLLSLLGLPHSTKQECEASIKQAVNLELIPSHYERIGEALAALLENIEANK